jgi:peptidoglycan/LPS O-acetylase OafA/YrhL
MPRIKVIQDLRGLAALSVCWYHYACYNGIFSTALPPGIFRSSARYGSLGVEVFFVISGFILPYSLFRASYQAGTRNYGRYLWKRLSRLEPPYLISIVIMIGVMSAPHLLPWLSGSAPTFTVTQLLLHLGYLNSLFDRGYYLNPVFWTLGVEFQYYLLIGLMYPLIASKSRHWRILAWGLLAGLAFRDHFSSLGRWLFVFMLGFAVFQYRARIVGLLEFAAIFLLAIGGCWATVGKSATLVGVATCVPILFFVGCSTRVTAAIGDLSYSLYLIHLPVGGLVFQFTQPWGHGMAVRLVVIAAALASSVALAYILYRFVEKPCQRYAGALHFEKEGEATKL